MAEEVLDSIVRVTAGSGIWSERPNRYTCGDYSGWAFGIAWRAERVRDGSDVFLRVNLRPMEELAYWEVLSAGRNVYASVTVSHGGSSETKKAEFHWGTDDERNPWYAQNIGWHGDGSGVTTYDSIVSSTEGTLYTSLKFEGVGYGEVSIRIDDVESDGKGPSGDIRAIRADGSELAITGQLNAPVTVATMKTVYREPSTPTLMPSSQASSKGVLGLSYTVGGASSNKSAETYCTECLLEAIRMDNKKGFNANLWDASTLKVKSLPVKDGTYRLSLSEWGILPYLLRVSLLSATGKRVSSKPIGVFPPSRPVSGLSVKRFGNRGALLTWELPKSSGNYSVAVDVNGVREATLGKDAKSWQSASLWPGDGNKTVKEFSVATVSTSEGYEEFLKSAGVTAIAAGYASGAATAKLSNGGNPPDPPSSVSADNVVDGKAGMTCRAVVSYGAQAAPTLRGSVEACLSGDWGKSKSAECPATASGSTVFDLDASGSAGMRYKAYARMESDDGTSEESVSAYVYGPSVAPESVEVRRDGFDVSVWAQFAQASGDRMEPYDQRWSCSMGGFHEDGAASYSGPVMLMSKTAADGSALLLEKVTASVLTYPGDKGTGTWDSAAVSGETLGSIGPVSNIVVSQLYGSEKGFSATWDRPKGDTGNMGVTYEVATVYDGVRYVVADALKTTSIEFDGAYRGAASLEVVAVRNGHRSEPASASYLYQPMEISAPKINGADSVDGVTFTLRLTPAVGGTPVQTKDGNGYRYVVFAGAAQDASQVPAASEAVSSSWLSSDGNGIRVVVSSPETVWYRVAAVDAAGYMSDLSDAYGLRMGTPGTGVLVYGAQDVLVSECVIEGASKAVSALGGAVVSVRDCVMERVSGDASTAGRYYNADEKSSISEDGVSWKVSEA